MPRHPGKRTVQARKIAQRRAGLPAAAYNFLYGTPRVREETPETARPEGYDGTHRDGVYIAGHHDEDTH